MKILHVVPSYYPAFRFGGPIQAIHNINKAIIKKWHTLDLLTTNAGIDKQNKVVLNKWIELDGLKVMYKSFLGYEHYNFSIPLTIEVFRLVKNYDVIHITAVWNYPVLVTSLASIFHHKTYIISPRGELMQEALIMRSTKKKYFYYSFLSKHYLKRASAIHLTSEIEKEDIANKLKYNVKYLIVPNGIELAEYERPSEKT